MKSQRAQIVHEIDVLQAANCKDCQIKREFGRYTSKLDLYCSSECPIGTRLVTLGRELIGCSRPRQKLRITDRRGCHERAAGH